MRTITMLDIITTDLINDQGQTVAISPRNFVCVDLLGQDRWRADDWCDAGQEIFDAFRSAKPGDVVELTDATHEKLIVALKAAKISEALNAYLLPLYRALHGVRKAAAPEAKAA